MSYSVSQGNTLGRIGTAVGQGIGDQLPKEVDRYRLSQGLQNFEKESPNLSPIQALARLSSIPGITPQMIQSFGELAKQQNMRNSFNQGRKQEQSELTPAGPSKTAQALGGINFLGGNFQNGEKLAAQEPRGQPLGNNQINPQNPTTPEFTTAKPWTPERRNDEIGKVWDANPGLTFDQATQIASDNEKRYLDQPEYAQKEYDRLNNVRNDVRNEFKRQLELNLEKEGKNVYEDITGENISEIERLIERDIKTNPESNPNDVVSKWTKKLLDLAKTKSNLKAFAQRPLTDQIDPRKKSESLSRLKTYAKTFRETGNSEELSNILQSSPDHPQTPGFGMSPQGANSIAYEPSERVGKYLNNIKAPKFKEVQFPDEAKSRKYAVDIEDLLSRDDSLLSIAYNLKKKDPTFDQQAFFDQLREDLNNINSNARQRRDLEKGVSDILPNWGDIWILPF